MTQTVLWFHLLVRTPKAEYPTTIHLFSTHMWDTRSSVHVSIPLFPLIPRLSFPTTYKTYSFGDK